jgi:hypothetical protein
MMSVPTIMYKFPVVEYAVLERAVLDCAVLDCAVLECAVLDCQWPQEIPRVGGAQGTHCNRV